MNVFHTYTLKSLKKNKTRTVVTIIGIILSVAMFTAVTEAFASAQHAGLEYVKNKTGTFTYSVYNQTAKKINSLLSDENIECVDTIEEVGYAEFDSAQEGKPYIYIGGMSEDFTKHVAVNLAEGRMPQTSDEIIITETAHKSDGSTFKVGEKIVLEVGKRTLNGENLTQNDFYDENEEFSALKEKTYTVVGLMKRPDNLIERDR